MPHWLSTDQAAQYLGYREGTLRVWRAKDQGPPYVKTPSGSVRYSSDDLETWINSLTRDVGATDLTKAKRFSEFARGRAL